MDQPIQHGMQQDNGRYFPALDLNLASAANKSMSNIPAPGEPKKPGMVIPALTGSPELGGIDPAQPIPHLNLAGSDGVPAAAEIAHPTERMSGTLDTIHTPDFMLPDTTAPDLHPYNLVAPGIDYAYSTEFAPDALILDLSEYARPYGLDMQNLARDGMGLFLSDQPQGLHMIDHPLQADPTMPDLQHPQLEQELHMPERPSDLARDALNVMHAHPTCDEATIPYAELFMDQSGMNTARRRHMNFLQSGLES